MDDPLHQAGTERREEALCRRPPTTGGKLLAIIQRDPLVTPPPYEKLVGDLTGAYSRRINIQHRLVYQLIPDEHIVKVLRMWTHYE